ncbi:hypothetical protein [Paenibacillus ehimensis]|uniref:hypothetical protein n=1 Tax=Paenibacillus ehimensis TaxID=79264 RepID=UPI000FDC4E8C|nr:hypothetical protein [Paenibacillus ehimensis]
MMDFYDVVKDLKKLKNKKLESIIPGSDITLLDVTENGLIIENTKGKQVKRPLSEMKRIVQALSSEKPVHVESILEGSGSSRNQPETILANLPYIEWLKIKNKKHIVWVKERTHPYGTKKEVDPETASMIKTNILTGSVFNPDGIIQTRTILSFCINISDAINYYKEIMKQEPETIDTHYAVFKSEGVVIVLRKSVQGISEGTSGPLVIVQDIEKTFMSMSGQTFKVVKIESDDIFPKQLVIYGPENFAVIYSEKLHTTW